jgi:hypothetical protein
MIKVRVEVRNETGSFTVTVHAENLQHSTRIAQDLYPGSVVGIVFPIEPDGFFAAGPHCDGRFDLRCAGDAGKAEEPIRARPVGR